MQAAEIRARMVLLKRKLEIWSWAMVHTKRKRRWLLGPSHWQRLLRSFGPAAEM